MAQYQEKQRSNFPKQSESGAGDLRDVYANKQDSKADEDYEPPSTRARYIDDHGGHEEGGGCGNGHNGGWENSSNGIEKLMEEFKNVYKENGAHDFQSQVTFLAALADYYHQKGADNSDWVCLLKAHSLYNSTAARDKCNGDTWSQKAFEVQKTCWGEKIQLTYEQQKEITDCVGKELAEVRTTTQSKLNHIKENYTNFDCEPDQLISESNQKLYIQFIEHVGAASKYCTDSMVNVFHKILNIAVEIAGEPPCKFCASAIGSIARGEATPYSDLEFLFLLEAKSQTIVKYFKTLAITVYFIIGNIQETKLRYMAIEELSGWFEDTSTNGLKIDGLQKHAGNIPTGNGSTEQLNHFICTVDELASRYEEVYTNPDPKESLRGDLTAMLSCTIAIYGETELLNAFKTRIQQLKPNDARKKASGNMMKNDTEKFDFYPDETLIHKRNLKSDIYRYPSLLVFNLNILHGLSYNTTELLEELVKGKILSTTAANNLRFTHCSALYMRLSTYLYHRSQNESISVLKPEKNLLASPDSWHMDQALFLHMMIHLIPLKKAVSSSKLQLDIVTSDTDVKHSLAIVSFFSDDYQTCFNALKDLDPDQTDSRIKFMIAYSLYELGDYDEAERMRLDLLQIYQERYASDHIDIAYSYNNLGLVSSDRGDYKTAEIYFLKSLEMKQRLFGDTDHPSIAMSYNNLGLAYFEQGDYNRAETYYTKSQEMRQRLYSNSDHPDIANTLNNLGIVYKIQGDYQRAEVYHIKSLEMKLRLYSNSDHPYIARSYNSLGVVSIFQGDFKKAVMYYTKSLEMRQRLYSSADHPVIAHSYGNLGEAYSYQGDYKSAEDYVTKSLEMLQTCFNNSDHPDIAGCYSNLGSVYYKWTHYKKAGICYTKAFEMMKRVFSDSDHPDLAGCYNNLGNVCCDQGDYKAAEMYYTKSLEMRGRLHSNSDHPEIANSYDNLGNVCTDQKDYKTAETYYVKSLEISERVYKGSDHHAIARCYNNFGKMYCDQGLYEKAETYHLKALEMKQRLHGSSDHLSLVTSYNNLGILCSGKGDSASAASYFAKAREMKLRILQNTVEPTAPDSYANLTQVLTNKGESEKAVY